MREIKFRVRNESNKKIIGFEFFNTCLNNGYYYIDIRNPVDDGEGGISHVCKTEFSEVPMLKPDHPIDSLLREQYTGSKDVNGVEMYEGDIVCDDLLGICQVKFDDIHAAFKLVHKNGSTAKWFVDYLPNEFKYLKVIGDIHENPELLEKSK